jgi:hypothetical protein
MAVLCRLWSTRKEVVLVFCYPNGSIRDAIFSWFWPRIRARDVVNCHPPIFSCFQSVLLPQQREHERCPSFRLSGLTHSHTQELVAHFDAIDPEQGFTSMGSLFTTIISGRAKERASLLKLTEMLAAIHRSRTEPKEDFLEGRRGIFLSLFRRLLFVLLPLHIFSQFSFCCSWALCTALHGEFAALPEAERNLQVACQVLAIHMASQSNLFAAIAWTLVNIASHKSVTHKVEQEIAATREQYGPDWMLSAAAMNGFDYLEKCYHESIRIAQHSLTLRLVLKPVVIDGYTVVPGYYIATLLSCLNKQDDLLANAQDFLPEQHYERGGKGER